MTLTDNDHTLLLGALGERAYLRICAGLDRPDRLTGADRIRIVAALTGRAGAFCRLATRAGTPAGREVCQRAARRHHDLAERFKTAPVTESPGAQASRRAGPTRRVASS